MQVIQKLNNNDMPKNTLQRKKSILEEYCKQYRFYLVTESETKELTTHYVTFQF